MNNNNNMNEYENNDDNGYIVYLEEDDGVTAEDLASWAGIDLSSFYADGETSRTHYSE